MNKEQNKTILKLISLLYRWRKFLVVHIILISIVAVVISLVIPKTFTSSATILPPSTNSFSSFLPPQMTTGLGGAISALTGDPGSDTFRIMSILKSRQMAEEIIDEFDLVEMFEAPTIEDAIEEYSQMIGFTIDEEMMIRVSCYAKTKFFHPENDETIKKELAFNLCVSLIEKLETQFSFLQSEKATNDRIVIENRLNENIDDLNTVEKELKEFSKEHGIVALPEQFEALVLTAAELESNLIISEIELASLRKSFTEGNQQIQNKEIYVNEIRNQLLDLRIESRSDSLSILPSLNATPDLALIYAQLIREQEIQSILYQFLIQQYEQLKLQETRDTPVLQFIDRPVLPQKRISPTRSITAIAIFMVGIVLGLVGILLYEEYKNRYKGILDEISNF